MIRLPFVFALITAFFLTVQPVAAHDGATGIVKERMDLFKEMAKSTKAMGAMAKGEAEMDLKVVQSGAEMISKHATTLIDMFPHGSRYGVSEAKKNIWTDWANFKAGLQKLSSDAENLAIEAKIGDADAAMVAFKEMAGVCKTCHKVFREEK